MINDLKKKLLAFIAENPGTVIGTLLGLAVGLMVISFGLTKVIILLIIILIFFLLGRMRDMQG
ncbi:DUF2273 domain-containing protein [Candidatus Desantisbacteria bacterium]|nr:DUF2273 domain-containing protein [Candidatus Desantisbacteria bacterium]